MGKAVLRLGHADGQPVKAHRRVELHLGFCFREVFHARCTVHLLGNDLDFFLCECV